VATYPVRVFGDPVLRERAREVETFDGDLARLVETMYETMYDAAGVGLAAPQVGIRRRLFTWDVGDGPHVLINPVFEELDGEAVYEEGCLSVPGYQFELVRPARAVIVGLDVNGDKVTYEDDDFLARVFQHEVDHLDGVLLLQRLDPEDRREAMKAIRTNGLGPALKDSRDRSRL
jgi:peptide deformylase